MHKPANAKISVLPRGYGSTRQLFGELRDFLGQHPGLDEKSVRKLAYSLFAILFAESATTWPFVSIVAPDAAASTVLLRQLEGICPSAVHVSEITIDDLLSLPESARLVLLVDVLTPSRNLERVLRTMSRPGSRVIRKGKLRDVFCPVVLCTAEPLRDHRLNQQAVHVTLTPSRKPLPQLGAQFTETFSTLQEKLAQYRDANAAKVRESQFDVPAFTSPTREIASMLGRCIVDDAELQQGIISLLSDSEQDSRARQANSMAAIEIEVGLALCHDPKRQKIRLGEFADLVNAILANRGETVTVGPRALGDDLRSLEFFSRRLGRAGRGLLITNDVRDRFHELAIRYDVRSVQNDRVDRCRFCTEARVAFGGVKPSREPDDARHARRALNSRRGGEHR